MSCVKIGRNAAACYARSVWHATQEVLGERRGTASVSRRESGNAIVSASEVPCQARETRSPMQNVVCRTSQMHVGKAIVEDWLGRAA